LKLRFNDPNFFFFFIIIIFFFFFFFFSTGMRNMK